MKVARGATENFTFTVSNDAGLLTLVPTDRIYFTLKTQAQLAADPATITKRSTAAGGGDTQIEILNQVTATGQYKVKLLHTDTAPLVPSEVYFVDSWIVRVTGEWIQVLEAERLSIGVAVETLFPT